MCRLLGFVAPTASCVLEELGESQTKRFQLMARLHDDGWGTARVTSTGAMTSTRCVDTGHDNALLAAELHRGGARAEIVHLRLATDDMATVEANTHPFVADGIAMAHNGSIVPTDALRALVDPELRSTLQGTTDSELYFAVIRQHIRAGCPAPQALARAVLQIRESYPAASLNAMVLTAECLCVVRSSRESIPPWEDFVASGLGDEDLPLNHQDAYFRMNYRRSSAGGYAFSSAGLEIDGWDELPDDQVACVSLDDGELTLQSVEDAAAG